MLYPLSYEGEALEFYPNASAGLRPRLLRGTAYNALNSIRRSHEHFLIHAAAPAGRAHAATAG
ncbi:MAG: hypothetical protein ABI541_05425, partial [Betaproteobacteria bacterium]